MKPIRITVISSLLLIVVGGYLYQQFRLEIGRMVSEDPRVWESVISEFERADKATPPPADAFLFIGSSSIRLWDSLTEDMQPLTAFGRGFGGAKIMDLGYYSERIVKPYQPRAVVVYIGGNDFSRLVGNKMKSLEQGQRLYRMLIERLHQAAPAAPIYLLALRPKPDDPLADDLIAEINQFMANEAKADNLLRYIDVNAVFHDDSGQLDEQYISWDTVHINQRGYEVWGSAIKKQLLTDFGIE
jgi:GDSL-like lipase/acylhydrolase family protein